jgi:putative transcriptional regulator
MTPPSGLVQSSTHDGAAGARIREIRRDGGLTQQELAAAVEVSRQTIIAMEKGDYAPSVYLALKVARTLGVTVEELWGASAS